ncbi:ATP-binding cassette domain-containing protein [Holzapfeliella sp. He02]|uniref:ATP-binding cassette domain-containing protein n=1 Tax=Holzapfeliella saturejae TaxID=3082953 RepID=A0ABU8SHN2_9LACO
MTKPVIKLSHVHIPNRLDISKQEITINQGDKVAILGQPDAGQTAIFDSLLQQVTYSGTIDWQIPMNQLGVYFNHNDYPSPSRLKVKELVKLVLKKPQRTLKQFYEDNQLVDIKNEMLQNLTELESRHLTLTLVLAQEPAVYLIDGLTTELDTASRHQLSNQLIQATQQ